MKLAEVLRLLHQTHKETTRLLFDASVNESEAIRSAVAKADLALGNAASLVRQRLAGTQGINAICADPKQAGHNGKAQKSTCISQKRVASSQATVSANGNESATRAVAGVTPEDGLPDDEYAIQLAQNSWEYLDTIEHPSDRPSPRAA
jgi:hypothetical protein